MKFIKIASTLVIAFMILASCEDDFLETPPVDQIDASSFFNTAIDLETYTNSFYDMLPGQAVYEDDAASDNIVPLVIDERVRGTRIVPVQKGSGGWSWDELRSINFFLANFEKVEDEDAKAHYGGVAKFFRAYFYYNKVKRFGDVPLIDKVLDADDPALFNARNSRVEVMDFVLQDLNDAIAGIPENVDVSRITKYTALTLKARVCLFEGTFRKYHNISGADGFLNEAVDAAEELMNSGAYTLYSNGDTQTSYRELFDLSDQTSEETILARAFNTDFELHNIASLATSPTNGSFGMAKDLVNSYLLLDGSRFTDQAGYETAEFFEEMQARDPRLTQTTAGPDFTATGDVDEEPVDLSGTTTGYRVIKSIAEKRQWNNRSSETDIILFRYAEALLIFAEAKAELGNLSQGDLDNSINLLRSRAGMPNLSLADANNNPDVFLENMYPNVSSGANKGVILEIRRERRIELFMEGQRWDDLMRWKEGKKLEQPIVGVYFSSLGSFDFDGDGTTDVYLHDGDASGAPASSQTIIDINERILTEGTSGNLNPFSTQAIFDESKDYFYPIPLEDLNLNDNLTQNPGWE